MRCNGFYPTERKRSRVTSFARRAPLAKKSISAHDAAFPPFIAPTHASSSSVANEKYDGKRRKDLGRESE